MMIVPESGRGTTYVGVSPPSSVYDGMTWYNTLDKKLYVFVNNMWRVISDLYYRGAPFYGYVCGGRVLPPDSYPYYSSVERFSFPLDSGTSTIVGNLSGSRAYFGANNSSIYGYTCGGRSSEVSFSSIDRFKFPFDSGSCIMVGTLSYTNSSNCANNSSTYGYSCSGIGSPYLLSVISRFAFPFDSGNASIVGTVSLIRVFTCGCNSSVHGYVCGGGSLTSNVPNSVIERFRFPFDSGVASAVGFLSRITYGAAANNSSMYGYVCGNGSIDRFEFPFDGGISSIIGNLSVPDRGLPAATDTTDFVTLFV